MKKGFTILELLVVIAIIGILSSVVLASLNSARSKSEDAAVKNQLSQLRTAAAIIYNTTGNYETICDDATDTLNVWLGAYSSGTAGGQSGCFDSNSGKYGSTPPSYGQTGYSNKPGKWGASVLLSNGNWYCVDYTGASKEVPDWGVLGYNNDFEC